MIELACGLLLVLGAWQAIPWRAERYLYYVFSFVAFTAFVAIGLPAVWLAAAVGSLSTAFRALAAPRGSGVPSAAKCLGATTVATVLTELVAHGLVVSVGLPYPLPVTTPWTMASFTVVLAGLFGAMTAVKELALRAMSPMSASPLDDDLEPRAQLTMADYLLGALLGGPLHLAAQLLFVRGLVGPWIGAMLWSLVLNAVLRRQVARDARARETLQELARQEQLLMVGELRARVIHQTRHQLGLIGIAAHRIGKRISTLSGDEARVVREELEKLEEIQRELGEMLTTDLRGASKPEAQGSRSYRDLVDAVVRRLGPVAETRGIRLEVVARPAPTSAAPRNAESVSHALFNVVENALTAARQLVRVELSSASGQLVISVLDDGPGLTASTLARATEPFFTTKSDGTGMGLAIARAAFAEEGAQLCIANRAEGGCQVQIAVPERAAG
ncbi:MAG: HAMP domain-containing sensor histidine kinase [Myxococcales bacterium]